MSILIERSCSSLRNLLHPSDEEVLLADNPRLSGLGWIQRYTFKETLATRILGPQEYGTYGMAVVIVGLAASLCETGATYILYAHQDAALSMPEMKRNQNCLLGCDIQEIVEIICLAVLDSELCERLGRSGYEAFSKYFLVEEVSDRIWNKIEQFMSINISKSVSAKSLLVNLILSLLGMT
jgi:hypothetical protein